MTINICLATDENYWNYMATAITSILKTSNKKDKLHFYILCNQISHVCKNQIKTLEKIKKFNITFIDLDIKEFESFPSGGPHISNTTYFRYKIAELLPEVSKIIYLDCDTIVKQSLFDLFNTDLSNYYLAGVEDVGYYYWRHKEPKYVWKEGFYINAGMLLINLEAWRKNKLFEKLIDFTIKEADRIAIGDQDVINQVCFGKIKPLDYKWNVQDSFYRAEPERSYNPNCTKIIEASKKPAIIHYTYIKKPWNFPTMNKAEEYWKCYKFLPYYDKKKYNKALKIINDCNLIKLLPKITFTILSTPCNKILHSFANISINDAYDLNLWSEFWNYLKKEIYYKDKSYSKSHILYKIFGLKFKIRRSHDV